MKPKHLEPPHPGVEKPGWYVVGDGGEVLAGPFDFEQDAWDWIEQNRPGPRI